MTSTTIERPLPEVEEPALTPETEALLHQFFATAHPHVCCVCQQPAKTACDGDAVFENECDAWMCAEHTHTVNGWCCASVNYCPICFQGVQR